MNFNAFKPVMKDSAEKLVRNCHGGLYEKIEMFALSNCRLLLQGFSRQPVTPVVRGISTTLFFNDKFVVKLVTKTSIRKHA